jgi:polar amino acid transport system substrate-binding protein
VQVSRVRQTASPWWRTAAVIAVAGAVSLSGCAKNTEGPAATDAGATATTSVAAKKVDDIAATVPEDIRKSGKLVVVVNLPYPPNEY